jgi:hypothetical protein
MQTHLEKLRREAAECLVLSNLATDPAKRELFARVAEHMTELASAVQKEVAGGPLNEVRAADTAVVDQKQAARSRQLLPWFVVVVLLAAAGAFVLAGAKKDPSSATVLEAKAEPPPTLQEDTNQAIAKFLSAEDEKRKALLEQLGALAARVDKLEKAHAEIAEPTTKSDAGTVRQLRQRNRR